MKSLVLQLREYSESLDFYVGLMDDFQVVSKLEFFDQVPTFTLPTANSFSIPVEDSACVILIRVFCQGMSKELLALHLIVVEGRSKFPYHYLKVE